MTELIINSLPVKEYPTEFEVTETNIEFTRLNKILGPFRDVCYYLHGGKLYFIGDEEIVSNVLKANGFRTLDISTINLDLFSDWEIVRPILYRSLSFYFTGHELIWKPVKKKQAFILKPITFEGERLVHEIYNNYEEKLIVYEGFSYWLEFLDGELVLTLLPKVKPILALSSRLKPEDIKSNKREFQEIAPPLIRKKGFFKEFRKIALKGNHIKRKVLKAIVKLLSNGKEEIIIPTGNLSRGLVFESNLITTEKEEADFYGE